MAITHVFKGASDNCGTFAYIENGALVVGENASRGAEYLFRGSIREFGYSDVMLIVHNRNPELVTDIYEYHWRNTFNRAAYKQEIHMNRNKLCEIKVDRADSLKEMVYHLTANGYEVQTAVIWKEFPNTGIDCWQIAIFNKE
jgi:hypothetical protein